MPVFQTFSVFLAGGVLARSKYLCRVKKCRLREDTCKDLSGGGRMRRVEAPIVTNQLIKTDARIARMSIDHQGSFVCHVIHRPIPKTV